MSGEQGGSVLGFIAATAGCAICLGLAVITATVLVVDALRSAYPTQMNPALYLLFGGTLAGVLTASGTAWKLLGPIASTYRRGGLAMVTGFATVLLMLICIPIHQLLGRTGLIALTLICLITAAVLGRQAKQRVVGP